MIIVPDTVLHFPPAPLSSISYDNVMRENEKTKRKLEEA
jgi:hypothetical protein